MLLPMANLLFREEMKVNDNGFFLLAELVISHYETKN